jgi:hypothetical protein
MKIKKYVKRLYVEEAYCDKCGSLMEFSGMTLTSYPAQYPYHCTNAKCDGVETFMGDEKPGTLKFEYEELNCPDCGKPLIVTNPDPESGMYYHICPFCVDEELKPTFTRGTPEQVGEALKKLADRWKTIDVDLQDEIVELIAGSCPGGDNE